MISAIDFLESAKYLSKLDNETALRNAISRAYYAAYHAVLPLDETFDNHGGIKRDVGMHEQLITKLENCPRSVPNWTKLKSIGVLIRMTKAARVEADYDLAAAVCIEKVNDQIMMVEKIFEKLKEI